MLISRLNAYKRRVASVVVAFTNDPYSLSIFDSPGPVNVQFVIYADGRVEEEINGGFPNLIGTWGVGVNGSDYDFFFDQQSPGGPNMGLSQVNAWFNGSGGSSEVARWGCEDAGGGFQETDCILRIRPAGGGADLATADVHMDAEAF